jgi:precorrin-6B methylase 1
VTPEARAAIAHADVVLHGLDDPVARSWIVDVNPQAQSLLSHYAEGRSRRETYDAMVEAIVAPVRAGQRVCAALYGHPGVYARPGHEAVRRARAEGFEARMLPAVSSEDCLFADLGVDPGDAGWQSHEATHFLLYRRRVDPSAALVLWQVGGLGDRSYPPRATPERLAVLVEYLAEWYPAAHRALAYQASSHPFAAARREELALGELPASGISPMATLYVPPAETRAADPTMLARLGLAPEDGR